MATRQLGNRETCLHPEPFVGPETLTDFMRGLKAVATLRADLVDMVAAKAAEVSALEKDIAQATSYVEVLSRSFDGCPPTMASVDFRVLQMNAVDECAKNAREWKLELGEKLAEARARLDELTLSLYDMNEAVRLSEIREPRRPRADGFSTLLAFIDGSPELDEVRAAVEDLRDEAKTEASKRNCPICWDRASTHACAPCGHMYCETCAATLHVCASCRGDVRQTIKIFY